MKKLFFILTFLFVGTFTQKVLADNLCSGIEIKPVINFSTSYGKLAYDFSKGLDELTVLGKKYGILESGLFASGLSIVGVDWEMSIRTQSKIMGVYDICVIPVTVDVFVGYSNPIIYVSKDLRPGSCEYNVVIRHEQTHQQINQTALEYFAPLMKKALGEIVKKVPAIYIDSLSKSDAATNVITDKYTREFEIVVNNFKKEIAEEQQKLDSHRNYRLEGSLCKEFNNH